MTCEVDGSSAGDLLTVAQVEELTGLSRSTIYRRRKAGTLPCHRMDGWGVRFKRSDVEAYQASRLRPAS